MAGGLGMLRRALQAESRALGLPATQTTPLMQRRLEILRAEPKSWSQEDLRAVAPHLYVHQDLRPKAKDRIDAILESGVTKGMVDPLDAVLFGTRWSWGRGLGDGVAYIMPPGRIQYRSATSPWLQRAEPMFYAPVEQGMQADDLLQHLLRAE